MARPTKWRRIEQLPEVFYFSPSPQVLDGPKNVLKIVELEAVRLKDLEGLEQEECAERMEISRPTFQRILISAREKIADSLVRGKGIHVEGGRFSHQPCRFECLNCGKSWEGRFEDLRSASNESAACPECGSVHIDCRKSNEGRYCRGRCRRHGRQEEK